MGAVHLPENSHVQLGSPQLGRWHADPHARHFAGVDDRVFVIAVEKLQRFGDLISGVAPARADQQTAALAATPAAVARPRVTG